MDDDLVRRAAEYLMAYMDAWWPIHRHHKEEGCPWCIILRPDPPKRREGLVSFRGPRVLPS